VLAATNLPTPSLKPTSPDHPNGNEQGKVVTVGYATTNGTATAPADYTATSGTLTFAPGETTKAVTVDVVGDTAFEGDETLSLVLSGPVNAALGAGQEQATATISNDDAPPSFSIAPASYVEGTACANNSGGLVVALSGAAVRVGMGWLNCICVSVCIVSVPCLLPCRANSAGSAPLTPAACRCENHPEA
jgi:hypothetical protein